MTYYELKRALSLPEWSPSAGLSEQWTGRLALEGAPPLRDKQAECLEALAQAHPMCGGLFGLDVGAGKTLLGMLAPKVLGCEGRALLLTMPSLVEQTKAHNAEWSERYYPCVPPEVVSYTTLSGRKGQGLLERIRPRLIICDEAHTLGNMQSARTKRFLRFAHMTFREGEEPCRFVFMSGSFLKRSIHEIAHLAALALVAGSPLPVGGREIYDWAPVLDLDGEPTPQQLLGMRPLVTWAGEAARNQQAYRRAFRKRVLSTPGVVWSSDGSCDQPLEVSAWQVERTPKTEAALKQLGEAWELPDGTPLVSGSEVYRHAHTLPYGFYLAWDWDAVGGLDEEWDEARRAWAREVRAYLTYSDNPLIDSESYVLEAAEKRTLPSRMLRAWDAWCAVSDRPRPPTTTRVHDIAQLGKLVAAVKQLPDDTLVWTSTPQMAEFLPLPYHGAGSRPPEGGKALVSSAVHGTGWNGQHYHRSLVLQPESGAGWWQQLLGRTHRGGQTRPVQCFVSFQSYFQRNNWRKAKEAAGKRTDLLGQSAKIMATTL